jgi:predicted metalloprotease with PDZ domain
MSDLSRKYGKTTPFKDDELFGVISDLTYPEIDDFINQYIIKGDVLPYEEIFNTVGVDYAPYLSGEEYSLGFTLEALTIDTTVQKIKILDADKLDDFGQKIGFKTGDILLKLNNKLIPKLSGMSDFFMQAKSSLGDIKELSYTVLRATETVEEEVVLTAPVEAIFVEEEHMLRFTDDPTDEQLRIRGSWLQAN